MPPKPKTKEEIAYEKKIILNNALEIFSESGYSGLTMRDLAKKCEYSPTKIYYYFLNKDEILLSLTDAGFRVLYNNIVESTKNLSTNRDKFLKVLEEIFNFGINEANYFNLMFGIGTPKYNYFISLDDLHDTALLKKNDAIWFYNFIVNMGKDFAKDYNKDYTEIDIFSMISYIIGILTIHNSKMSAEVNLNINDLFQSSIKFILANFDN